MDTQIGIVNLFCLMKLTSFGYCTVRCRASKCEPKITLIDTCCDQEHQIMSTHRDGLSINIGILQYLHSRYIQFVKQPNHPASLTYD